MDGATGGHHALGLSALDAPAAQTAGYDVQEEEEERFGKEWRCEWRRSDSFQEARDAAEGKDGDEVCRAGMGILVLCHIL